MIENHALPLGDSLAGIAADFGFGWMVAFVGVIALYMAGFPLRSRGMACGVIFVLFIAGMSFAAHAKTWNLQFLELSAHGLTFLLAFIGGAVAIAALATLAYIVHIAGRTMVATRAIEAQNPRHHIIINSGLSDPKIEDWKREIVRGSLPGAPAKRMIERR